MSCPQCSMRAGKHEYMCPVAYMERQIYGKENNETVPRRGVSRRLGTVPQTSGADAQGMREDPLRHG